MRKAPNDLPSRLDDTYEDAMYRIQHQHEEHCELALRTLSWISKAQRPLRIEEVQHAVSVEEGDKDLEDEPLEAPDLLVSVCAGLVTIDAESNTFRLVHFTVEEFFEKNHHKWFPDADNLIAKTCLTYLSFHALGKGTCSNKSERDARSQKYVLAKYAARNWIGHAGQAEFQEFQPLALRFLGDEFKVAAAALVSGLYGHSDIYFHYSYMSLCRPFTGIWFVVAMKCLKLRASCQTCGQDAHTKMVCGRIAAQNSDNSIHLTMMRWLIESGADPNDSAMDGSTVLMIAAKYGWYDGVKLLLDQGANPHAMDDMNSTCFHHIVYLSKGHSQSNAGECIDLLLEAGLDIEARDNNGNTPLMSSLSYELPQYTRLLLQKGAAVTNDTNEDGYTLLMMAILTGYFDLGQLLLRSGLNVNAVNKYGESALMIASGCNSFERIAKLLLSFGADINASSNYGCTALMMAAHSGAFDYGGVELLLQSGANVDAVGEGGRTVLMRLVQICVDDDVVKLLLQSGANVNAVDIYGESAAKKLVRRLIGTRDKNYLFWEYRHLDHFLEGKGYSTAGRYAVRQRILRTNNKNVLRIILLHGLNEENRKDALALAMSYEGTSEEARIDAEEVTQMLSTPSSILSAMTLTSREKENLDLLHDCFRSRRKYKAGMEIEAGHEY